MRYRNSVLTVSILILLIPLLAYAQQERHAYRIRSGVVDTQPAEGERAVLSPGQRHLVVQFYRIPDSSSRRVLAGNGLDLVRYLGGNAYLASLSEGGAEALASAPDVRATIIYNPNMKLSPLFKQDEILRDAVERGSSVSAYVRFHEDVPFEQAARVLHDTGLSTAQTSYHYGQAVELVGTWSALSRLLEADEVDLLEPSLPPPETMSGYARRLVNADDIFKKKTFGKPSGRNVKVGIWDEGEVGQHGDLSGRVTIIESGQGVSSHSTHVSGIIAGNGAGNPKATGMAPRARIYSFNFQGNPFGEMERAISDYDVMISNNSWGVPAGWDYESAGSAESEDYWRWLGREWFGYYHSVVGSLDKLVRKNDFPVIWAAGNERNDAYLGPHKHGYTDETTEYEDQHPSDPNFGSITVYISAKNAIGVGAAMKDYEMTSFSSWGPTDDGRLKPDVVAPGYRLLSTIPGNRYDSFSGTSMATPVVTGTAALLMHSYKRLTKNRMGATTLKALMIHTARDLGVEGPDYSCGYGMIDSLLAAKVLSASTLIGPTGQITAPGVEAAGKKKKESDITGQIIEGSLDHRKRQSYNFTVPEGAKELRATLVWNDPPGPQLVNNLDLWAKRKRGKKIRPFTLEPSNPSAPALRKRNSRDNVEHILVQDPKSGKWRIYVRGRSVPKGPQPYSLIISAGVGNDSQIKLTEGRVSDVQIITSGDEDVVSKNSFAHGDDFYAHIIFRVLENADYGDFDGTISFKFEIRRESEVVLKYNAALGVPANELGQRWRIIIGKYIIPSEMPLGTYSVTVRVAMANGKNRSASSTFTVQ